MDQLQSPIDPSYPSLEILDLGFIYNDDTCIHTPSGLCTECHDGDLGNWFGFPDRMGWNTASIFDGLLRKVDSEHEQLEEAPAFLQAWLYFGILAFFFNDVNVISDFFRRKDNGTKILDTSSLPGRLLRWRHGIEAMSTEERTATLKSLNRAFGQLDNLCTMYLAGEGLVEGFQCPVSPELSLSIQILGESLYHAVYMVGGRALYMFGAGNTPLLLQRLKANFWCPRDIDNIGRICLTYYASLMGPRYPQIPHDDCTIERCRKLDVDEAQYVVKHIHEGCRCDQVSVPLQEVIGILEADQVPIVRWSEGTIQVISSGRRGDHLTAYIAISHVWADGLGNPQQNSLPLCQIERIQNLVNASFASQQSDLTPVWFWMDTLCVPITRDGTARKVAIGRMNRTYQEATVTLVLDAELVQRSRNCADTEVALRILFSRWAQRLWTLQEAVANASFVVQFVDGRVNSSELEASMIALGETVGINDPLHLRAYKWFRDLSKMYQTTERDERLVRTFQSTLTRTTSHARDELICTAALIGFDQDQIRELLDTPEARRACTFMQILGKAPRHLVLASGPRRTEYGFRWCPERLLTAFLRVSSNSAKSQFHTVTEDGLRGTWHAITFSAPSNKLADLPEMDQNDFALVDQTHVLQHWVSPIDSTVAVALESATSGKLAILLEGVGLFCQDFCCLVECVREEGGVTFARLIGKCFLQLYEPARQVTSNLMLELDVNGSISPTEGIWCIE